MIIEKKTYRKRERSKNAKKNALIFTKYKL